MSSPLTYWIKSSDPVGIVGSMLPDWTAAKGRLVPEIALLAAVPPTTTTATTSRVRSMPFIFIRFCNAAIALFTA